MSKCIKKEFKTIQYLMYIPDNFDETKKYPLFFHLHGAGSRGRDFENFKDSTILTLLEQTEDSPLSKAVCIFPQCHTDTWFELFEELIELVKYIVDLNYIDKTRITGSGISMGGYAMYQLMMTIPEDFTRSIICCGGGMYWNAGRLKNIKFKIFHGKKDVVVFPDEAVHMYDRLKEVGADAELTIYPDCDHNCWDKTFTNQQNLQFIIE